MATRSGRRTLQVLENIELPSLEAPQYVDSEGYEVDAETFALALRQTEEGVAIADGPEEDQDTGSAEEVEGDEMVIDDEVDDDGEVEEEEVEAAELVEDEPEERDPLLSLSDSNVLNYSLMATRQHHLKHLLPHVFSHPAIPANLRLRARPPPKGTFLWPTPPPLVHPLPQREYHGPSQPSVTNTSGSPAPVTPSANPATPNAEQPDGPAPPEQKRRKYARNKGKDKLDGVDAPAHEIECLARVTLSIGPVSYPGTELWVGRFVMPRAAAPKAPKVKREKAERKRPSAADGGAAGQKRPRAQAGAGPGRPPQYSQPPTNAVAGPSGYRPPRPPGAVYQGPGGAPRPPPQPRAELSPDLIRRVNEAATKHPWLSQIIHKAARTQATKEELAKLGRVVNRLKEGKDVGEGPDDPPPTAGGTTSSAQPAQTPGTVRPPLATPGPSTTSQNRPPSQSDGVARPPPSAAPPVRPPSDSLAVPQGTPALSSAASSASEPLTPPPPGDDSDSDSDVDMTGPRQVGGGPGGVDPAITTDTSAINGESNGPPTATSAPVAPTGVLPVASSRPDTTTSTADSSSFAAPSYRPPQPPTFQAQTPYRPPASLSPANPIQNSGATTTTQADLPRPPPPPPRPTYPLPPPFLLVAFKEALTEKFILPLGSLSYISRLGEKEDVAAAPTATPLAPLKQPSPISTPVEPVIPQAAANGPVKSRTRASLGRNLKPATPTPPPVKEEERPEEPLPEIKNKEREPPRSNLPPVSGMEPQEGTVLVSTFIPAGEWRKPDWKDLSTSLPFNNPLFEKRQETQTPTPVKTEIDATPAPKSPKTRVPKRTEGQEDFTNSELPIRGKLLNLATESFLPEDSEVHAVTIRFNDVSDQVWQRIKTISGMVATAEMKSLSEHLPGLVAESDVNTKASAPQSVSSPVTTQPPTANLPPRQPFQPTEQLREAYLTRKRNLFKHLLERVPSRKFLRFRLSSPRPDIADATVDRWAPRPYPISTKALYTREDDDDAEDAAIPLSPELQPKKGSKKGPEPTVTFEMPVSLDQLDERVAENAMKGNKGHGLDGRKRHGKRWVPGTICEGCGEANKRVWRAGPGGKGTLCNACADKWTSGTLGPLAAPGAASKNKDQDQDDKASTPAVNTTGADATTITGTDTNISAPVPAADTADTSSNRDAAVSDSHKQGHARPDGKPVVEGHTHAHESEPAGRVEGRSEEIDRSAPGQSEITTDLTEEQTGITADPPPSLQIDGKEIGPEAQSQPQAAPSPAERSQDVDVGTSGDVTMQDESSHAAPPA